MPASRGSSKPNSKAGTPNGARSGPVQLPASPRSPLSPSLAAMQHLGISPEPSGPSGPAKPGKGDEILHVLSNHFLLNPNDMPEFIYKSNFDVRPANPKPNHGPVTGRVKRRVIELLLKMPQFVAVYSDFVQALWSFKALTSSPNTAQVVEVDYYEREEPGPRTGDQKMIYRVQITPVTPRLPSQPLKDLLANQGTVIQHPLKDYEDALNNMVLRYAALHDQLTTAQRGTKIFPTQLNFPNVPAPPKRQELTGGLTAYRGYSRRAKFTEGGLMLALTTTAGVMYQEGRAHDLIKNLKKANVKGQANVTDPLRPEYHLLLNQFIKGVRVQGLFNTKSVKLVLEVLASDAQNTFFHCETHPKTGAPLNNRQNVVWFFKEAYNLDVSPRGPVLNVGSEKRSIYWPAEFCQVLPAQSYRHVLPLPEQAQHMIKFACRSPADNARLITTEGHEMVGVRRSGGPHGRIEGTPLKIWLDMAAVPARRIASPSLVFGNGTLSSRDASKGQWNLQGRKFSKSPRSAPKFTVIVLKRNTEPGITNLPAVKEALSEGMRRYCGIDARCTTVPEVADTLNWPSQDQVGWLKRLFIHCGKSSNVGYCFVIPSSDKWYKSIKEAGDSVGMQTTVTLRQRDNTARASPGEIANLMLKFSMKTLGINWTLAIQEFNKILKEPTMLLGLDVVHPPPGALKGAPSVAGLVYSVDPAPGQFLPVVSLLVPEPGKAAREVVPTGSLKPMVEYAFQGWQKHNKELPRRIFMCRDGVSETQLQQVLDEELPAIKQAAMKFYAGRQPPEVFILNTQKRHITRLFKAKDDKKSTAFDQKGNPLPGLIVDSKIVSRSLDDWYSVSHKCLQGTSRPAHHVRLYDEIHLPKYELQRLVHNLSFIYPRSVTSVSIPTPAKLADLLCERAKVRLHSVYFPAREDALRTWSINDPGFRGQQDVHGRIRDTMYYI